MANPMRRVVGSSVLPAGVFALLLVVGVDLVHCVLLAGGVLVLSELRALPDVDDGPPWPARSDRIGADWPESGGAGASRIGVDRSEWGRIRVDRIEDRGVRREVAHLAWSLPGSQSRVDRRLVERLRAIADQRLATKTLDLGRAEDTETLQTVLGARTYRTLTDGLLSRPTLPEFERAVSVVEGLQAPRGVSDGR